MELFVYEAYGPGGVGMVIEAVTENRQRTVSLIKNVLDHQGGSLATPGAVLYQFVRLGLIVIPKEEGESEDRLFSLAIDAGASDVVSFDDSMELYMPIPSLESVKQFIQQQNKQILTSEIVYRPTLPLPLDDPGIAEEIDALVEKLEELDDVQNVYTSLV
jgi:transcriptional/translational regulatory protein YebC/TACO1